MRSSICFHLLLSSIIIILFIIIITIIILTFSILYYFIFYLFSILYYSFFCYYLIYIYYFITITIFVGSDLAGETAAALAASSMVFRNHDSEYSAKCLKHAKELYKFANEYRGLYHEAIRGAAQYYESTDYGDELAWAAVWLFKATNDTIYLEDAEHHYQHFHLKERPNEFFYNKKVAGVQVNSFAWLNTEKW